jgi:gamma-glutamylcyclotransferase (GGCT)/AIG2-like uncharacterized protein YtfP
MMTRVFVYGTLVASGIRVMVAPGARVLGEGRLEGWTVVHRSGLPTIVPEEGAWTPGLVLEVTADDLRSLDTYESLDHDLYRREEVEVGPGWGRAMTYVMNDRWM